MIFDNFDPDWAGLERRLLAAAGRPAAGRWQNPTLTGRLDALRPKLQNIPFTGEHHLPEAVKAWLLSGEIK